MLSFLLHFAWLFIQAFTGFGIVLPVALYIVYHVHKITKKQPLPDEELHEEKDYAIIISVHEQTEAFDALLRSLLQLNYTNYLIYVVVNNGTINLRSDNDKVVVLPAAKAIHSTAGLHRLAIENFRRSHTHVAILHSDSLVDKDYLNQLNACFHQGYQAVQSRSTAKNSHRVYDMIQSIGNLYTNFFRGELSFALGASATLSGSGSAFTVRLYKQCLKKIKVPDADFTITLQKMIVKCGYQIAYAQNALVYDGSSFYKSQLMQQHARTINTWLRRMASYGEIAGKGLLTGNANQLLSGIWLLRLPLFTNLLAAVFCFLLNVWINPAAAMIWAGCLLLFPLSMLMAAIHATGYRNMQDTATTGSEGDFLFQTISLYEEEGDDYNVVAQTS